MPAPGQIEAIPTDVFQPGEGRLELRRVGTRVIGAVPREEPVLVAMPFAVDGDRIIELRGTDLGQKPRPQHLGDEHLAGRGFCPRSVPRSSIIRSPSTANGMATS